MADNHKYLNEERTQNLIDDIKEKMSSPSVITYQQWQQLSQSQQENGEYFVTDWPLTPQGFDSTPTVGSNNPVTSNGIRLAIGIELGPVSKIVGDTSVTFSDSAIKTTSELELLCENSTNEVIRYTGVTVSAGSATYTFPALTVATDFYLKVR